MAAQNFKRNLLLNLYREEKENLWFVSSCRLREIIMSGICSLFPLFGVPWPSCLLPCHNLDSILKSKHYFANKGPSSQYYGFSSSHVGMWELDYKENRALKSWCFWTVVLENSWESLGLQQIQPVHPKGDQSWVFIGKTDAEVETLILWPPDAKNWLVWKDPDAGQDWRQEEKGTAEDEMVRWHHWLSGHEFE